MKVYICRECGHTDLASKADNGEHEPPSCGMCDSVAITISNNNQVDIDEHKDGAGNSLRDLYPFGLPKRHDDSDDADALESAFEH